MPTSAKWQQGERVAAAWQRDEPKIQTHKPWKQVPQRVCGGNDLKEVFISAFDPPDASEAGVAV